MFRFSLTTILFGIAIAALGIRNRVLVLRLEEARAEIVQLTADAVERDVLMLQDRGFTNGTGMLFKGTEPFRAFAREHTSDELESLVLLVCPPGAMQEYKKGAAATPVIMSMESSSPSQDFEASRQNGLSPAPPQP